MPRFDQTGPVGQGPMTGWRMGRCTNYGAGVKKSDPGQEQQSATGEATSAATLPEREWGAGNWFGRGRGRSAGMGPGRGMGPGGGMGRGGRGFRNRFRGGF